MVVGTSVAVEVLVIGRHHLQGIGQIERLLLFLCVKQDRELVRLCDDIDHPLVLTLIVFIETLLRFRPQLVCLLQLCAKVLQHFRQCTSAHDGPERNGAHKEC